MNLSGVWTLCAAGCHILGLILAQQRSHLRQNFSRSDVWTEEIILLNVELFKNSFFVGITTVLTMTFMGLEARKDLPKVTYPTALDYFVFISFMYIFSTVVQVTRFLFTRNIIKWRGFIIFKFGLVHHFTKLGSGEYYLEELENEICRLSSERKRRKPSFTSLSKTMSLPATGNGSNPCLPVFCSDTSLYDGSNMISKSDFSLINHNSLIRRRSR